MPERTYMLKDLFDMAFDADLLGYWPQAIEDVDAAKASIAERLVVDSFVEHLHEIYYIELLINEYLYATQFPEDAFGDAISVSLAATVDILGSHTLPRREEFLSAVDTVYKISSNGCLFNHNLNLANFARERGEGLAGDDMPADGTELYHNLQRAKTLI
ncbi:hypothetical protein N431DRAFT_466196 [Stipitochalara longipes BDJ]|nr:hypothetical protein N431DRAFT_466196 [Stipitochalara longipes BDJ]